MGLGNAEQVVGFGKRNSRHGTRIHITVQETRSRHKVHQPEAICREAIALLPLTNERTGVWQDVVWCRNGADLLEGLHPAAQELRQIRGDVRPLPKSLQSEQGAPDVAVYAHHDLEVVLECPCQANVSGRYGGRLEQHFIEFQGSIELADGHRQPGTLLE